MWDRARVFRRKTRPPTAFNTMDKACSAAAVHETAFCQAPLCAAYYQGAQCSRLSRARAGPPAALNGYDSTTLFHHASYAASYTACLSNMAGDATSYDRLRPDKTTPGHDGRRAPGAGEGIQREISFACDAIMYEQYAILYYNVGPTCRGPNSCVCAPLRYKGEVLAVHGDRLKLSQPSHSRGKAIQHTVDVGYYAPAARTTQNPWCSSCS